MEYPRSCCLSQRPGGALSRAGRGVGNPSWITVTQAGLLDEMRFEELLQEGRAGRQDGVGWAFQVEGASWGPLAIKQSWAQA